MPYRTEKMHLGCCRHVLGMQSFGLEECGDYDGALKAGFQVSSLSRLLLSRPLLG